MKYIYYYIQKFISPNNIKEINDIIRNTPYDEKALDNPAANARKTSNVKIYKYEVFWNLLKDFRHEVLHINNQFFGFKVFKPTKHNYINVNTYVKNQEYNWHIDANYGQSNDIKLTALLNISDNEYVGGNLNVFQSVEQSVSEFSIPGTLLVFPSYIPHRVTPLVSGTRKTITWFVEGPNWK